MGESADREKALLTAGSEIRNLAAKRKDSQEDDQSDTSSQMKKSHCRHVFAIDDDRND